MEGINRAIRDVNEQFFVESGKVFVCGGACDEETYRNDPIPTVFLLKEVNNPNGDSRWSLAEHIRNQADGQSDSETKPYQFYLLWKNVGRWMQLILNPSQDFNAVEDELRGALRHVAAINIKKTPGGSASDAQDLMRHATDPRNGELIRRELEILEPRLVVCGGTFELAKKLFGVKDADILPNGAGYFEQDGRVFLEFPHPAWFSVNVKILFAYFKDTFRELSLRKGWTL